MIRQNLNINATKVKEEKKSRSPHRVPTCPSSENICQLRHLDKESPSTTHPKAFHLTPWHQITTNIPLGVPQKSPISRKKVKKFRAVVWGDHGGHHNTRLPRVSAFKRPFRLDFPTFSHRTFP